MHRTYIYSQGSVLMFAFYGLKNVSFAATSLELKIDCITSVTRLPYIKCVKNVSVVGLHSV